MVEAFELMSGKKLCDKMTDVKIKANSSTELDQIDLNMLEVHEGTPFVIASKLVDISGQALSSTVSWPEP